MAWMELHTVLIRHRKIKKLARELNIEPVMAVGHIVSFWGNVLELAEDGNITKWSVEDIAEYSNYKGDPKLFYKALVNSNDGWIDEIDGLKVVHDWWDYAGRYLKTKYRNSNPEKLENIMNLYTFKHKRQSKDGLKTGNIDNIPNLPTYVVVDSLRNYYYVTYKQQTNKDYIKDTLRDKSVFRSLLKDIPPEEIKILICRFFDSNDQWIKNSGYTIGAFKSQINKLRTEKPQVRYV